MFQQFDFYIHDEYIEVDGIDFLLGELTCDILNISVNDFKEIWKLAKQLEHDKDGVIVAQLHAHLTKYRLFQLISKKDKFGSVQQYQQIVSDIYSFNQTMFWFVDRYIMHLKKLDAENYAAALFDFYQNPSIDKMMVNHFRDGVHAFTLFDTVKVQYEPRETPGHLNAYAIYEVYSVNYLQAFLKMDFMKAIMTGHIFRRCKNCKRFFLLTHGYKTAYCDRPLADNPKRTCRQQGAKNIAKEKAQNNPVIQSYNRAYRRITADKNRENINEEQWKIAKRKLADLRDMAVSGRIRDAEAEAEMQSETLYKSLGIDRKNKR